MQTNYKYFGWLVITLACLSLAVPSIGQDVPADPGTLVVGRTQLGLVNYGNHHFSVLPETQNYLGENPKFPGRWEFSVDPIFMPAFDQNGALKLVIGNEFAKQSKQVDGGTATIYTTTTRVGIPLLLSDDHLFEAAAASVTQHFADLNYTFKSGQVTTLPVSKVNVDIQDLKTGPCQLQNSDISVANSESVIYVWINCTDSARGHWPKPEEMTAVKHLLTSLPYTDSTLTVYYSARFADIGGAMVSLKSVKQTKLYAKLNGDGGQNMLVTRDDLRQLAMSAGQEIYVEQVGVRSPRCASDFVSDVMDHFKNEQKIESGQFTPQMLATTYNPNDVNPDEITKTFDKNISSSSTKDQVNISTAAGASFLGFSANGSLSGASLQERAASSDIEAEFNGHKWVAKSVKVLQVNISDFATNYHASCSDFSVGSAEAYGKKSIQMVFRPEHWTSDQNGVSTATIAPK